MTLYLKIRFVNLVCIYLFCYLPMHNVSADIIQTPINKSEVTQIHLPLVYHKSTYKRLLETGIQPKLVEKMLSSKHNKPSGEVTNDTIPIFKYTDLEYFAEILIGHPGQKFKVAFDTAWGDSFIPSKECPFYNVACRVHAQYDHKKSSTYKPNGKNFNVSIGSSEIKGYLSEDLLHIGHINITNQTFAEITDLPTTFFTMKTDGVFGMAFRSLSNYNLVPFFYNVMSQFPNMPKIFSFYVNRDSSSTKGGSLLLGAINSRHVAGNITYFPVNSDRYWQIKMDSAYFKNPLETFCSEGCNAIIDTGSSNIGVPSKDFDLLVRRLGAYKTPFSSRYQVNCNEVLKLPKITFVFNNVEFQIKGKDYILSVDIGPMHYCFIAFERANAAWTLGGAFLYQYYTIFDFQQKQIGIVKTNL